MKIYVFGAAAMVLAYKAREATRAVDALFEPRELGPQSRSRGCRVTRAPSMVRVGGAMAPLRTRITPQLPSGGSWS